MPLTKRPLELKLESNISTCLFVPLNVLEDDT